MGGSIQTDAHIARSMLECCDIELNQVGTLQIHVEEDLDKVRHDVLYKVKRVMLFDRFYEI